MFYISSKNNGLLGVTDSKDGIEEFYAPDMLKDIVIKLKLNVWGFIDSANSFNDSFVVDIDKFLSIIKNCTLLYRTLELGDTVTVSMANANGFYKGTTGKEAYNKFLKAFKSDISIDEALKFLALIIKWGNPPLTKFIGISYTGFQCYDSIDIYPNRIDIKIGVNKYTLRDWDSKCSKPYINNIEIQLLNSNLDIVCYDLPYSKSI